MRVLVTGAAGFIGYHASVALLATEGARVCGFDNFNDYYDPALKRRRAADLASRKGFEAMVEGDLGDRGAIERLWRDFKPDHVLHLAAQAGVRYSIENPQAYIQSNIVGFQNLIELVRAHKPINFVYASSSSVYGGNKVLPFSETQDVSNPISLYATTKIANELVAKTYGNLFGVNTTGLRFFTVYGPWGRPDMAMFKFAELMRRGEPIPVYNHGKMLRDFTYIDDIVGGVLASLRKPQLNQVYNLGRGKQVNLMDMIHALEDKLGVKAKLTMMPIQAGDVEATWADVSKARRDLGYDPRTDVNDGVAQFAQWYRNYIENASP